jgi:hypothetical protein
MHNFKGEKKVQSNNGPRIFVNNPSVTLCLYTDIKITKIIEGYSSEEKSSQIDSKSEEISQPKEKGKENVKEQFRDQIK